MGRNLLSKYCVLRFTACKTRRRHARIRSIADQQPSNGACLCDHPNALLQSIAVSTRRSVERETGDHGSSKTTAERRADIADEPGLPRAAIQLRVTAGEHGADLGLSRRGREEFRLPEHCGPAGRIPDPAHYRLDERSDQFALGQAHSLLSHRRSAVLFRAVFPAPFGKHCDGLLAADDPRRWQQRDHGTLSRLCE